jgi:myo-inositol-1(or 4)-monophosphatase
MSATADTSDDTLLELRALAVSVAREAGDLLANQAGQVKVAATKSSPTDVVTEMDRQSEELITARILSARPADAILAEEGGLIGNTDNAPVLWVVDPLDGTVNYVYGLHDWAVSIAAEVAGEILVGAVYVPKRGEMFSAIRGHGAWLQTDENYDWSPLRCRPSVPLDQALVGTGFGYLQDRRTVQGEVVAALLPKVRDIRRIGVASVDLCAVAAGRLDAYYERGLNYWDWAAGALAAAEAGAVVGGLNDNPVSKEMTVAATPGLFGSLVAELVKLNPERDA